jgi:hypothetical protein
MILLNYITPSELAKKLKISRQRLNVLINQKRVQPPPERIGRFYFVFKNAKIVKKWNKNN